MYEVKPTLLSLQRHPLRINVRWLGGRSLRLARRGRPTLRIADFKKGSEAAWSAEELLIGSLATCYEVTLVELAKQQAVPLYEIDVRAVGDTDSGYDFNSLELDVEVTTDRGRELDAEEIILLARKHFATRVLRVPVRLRRIEAHAAAAAADPTAGHAPALSS